MSGLIPSKFNFHVWRSTSLNGNRKASESLYSSSQPWAEAWSSNLTEWSEGAQMKGDAEQTWKLLGSNMITLISEPEYPTHRRGLRVIKTVLESRGWGWILGRRKKKNPDTNQGTSQVCRLITVVDEQVVWGGSCFGDGWDSFWGKFPVKSFRWPALTL